MREEIAGVLIDRSRRLEDAVLSENLCLANSRLDERRESLGVGARYGLHLCASTVDDKCWVDTSTSFLCKLSMFVDVDFVKVDAVVEFGQLGEHWQDGLARTTPGSVVVDDGDGVLGDDLTELVCRGDFGDHGGGEGAESGRGSVQGVVAAGVDDEERRESCRGETA